MSLRVGVIGTGAIAKLHARVYRNLGWSIVTCCDEQQDVGRAYAREHGAELVSSVEEVCASDADFVDVCTLPNVRLDIVELCAKHRKHVQVEKPIATTVAAAKAMLETARRGNLVLGVVSQHRFDESSRFLAEAIAAGRLGRLIQCDAYVKWYRAPAYYSRPVKGSWAAEGGGALINQGIHQIDLLRWLAGPVLEVFGTWHLGGAVHRIESEDLVNALLTFEGGATGVIQASTALLPGSPERLELHGTKGTAIVTGDKLTTWDVIDDDGPRAPVSSTVASGASDPMAISLEPFERQFRDFADAIRTGRKPLVSGEAGLQALEVVDAIYRSCRSRAPVTVTMPDAG